MSWSRGRTSPHADLDPISNQDSFDRKTEYAAKKSIVSCMKGLLQPKPKKLVGALPDEL